MIKINNLSKKFDEECNIRIKDTAFKDGRSYVLLGPSGCGKSTMLNMITGVITPTTGNVFIDGTEITKLTQQEKDAYRLKNIGYIFQDFKLIDDMTVEDNLNLLKLGDVDCLPIDEVLESVGIKGKRKNKVKHLSGGERQRVAIARALIKQPKIIIADEPTGNLNFENGKKVIELLMKASKKFSNTMIVVTHDDRLVEYFDEALHFEDMLIREGGNENV